MRLFWIIFFSFHLLPAMSQNWTLKVDKSKEYCYDYRFRIDDTDTNSYSLIHDSGSQFSTFFISDNFGDSILLAMVSIKNLTDNTVDTLPIDFSSTKRIWLSPGKYELKVYNMYFDQFKASFEIKENEHVKAKINLGENSVLISPYHIHSKIKLADSEIYKIIDCVKLRRKDPTKICHDKSKYHVTMEI
jgi:hypothetical protein